MIRGAAVVLAMLALGGCTGDEQQPPPADTASPAGIERAGGVVLLTAEVVPLEPDEFETGSGVGGTTGLGPDGCVTVRSGGQGPRRVRVARAGAPGRAAAGGGLFLGAGVEGRPGAGFDGGRGLRAPYDVTAAAAYPDLADELPAPCRRLPVFVVDEVYEVFPAR